MGLKLAKRNRQIPGADELLEDPKRIKEVAEWNRLRLLVNHEIVHEAWGYPLNALHRMGRITGEQREAGDNYFRLVEDYKSTQQIDPDDVPVLSQEFTLARIKNAKERYNDVKGILGGGRKLVDDLVFDHVYPAGERQHKILVACLEQLSIYFSMGKPKKPSNMV